MTYWILKRVYSDKVRKGRQPYVWVPQKRFRITTIPTSRLGWIRFVQKIAKELGEGQYRILRNHFKGETRGFRPVVNIEIEAGRYTITNRYTQFKAIEGQLQPFFKEHKRQIKPIMTAKERMRARKRAMLKSVRDQLAKPTTYEIKTVFGVKEFGKK